MAKFLSWRGALGSLALCGFLAGVSPAQDYRGKIQGNVADPTQAAVTGATVTLRNINTAIETVKQTDSTGHYLFDFVQPGT